MIKKIVKVKAVYFQKKKPMFIEYELACGHTVIRKYTKKNRSRSSHCGQCRPPLFEMLVVKHYL